MSNTLKVRDDRTPVRFEADADGKLKLCDDSVLTPTEN